MIRRFVGLFFISVISLFMITACDDDNYVLSNLSEQQANQTLAILHQYNVNAEKNGSLKSGYTINVDKNQITAALSIINQYQLPWQRELDFNQVFPNDSLVSSPDINRAKLISIQEQKLEQSLKIIDKVINAKVNISFPLDMSDISGHQYTEHAAVLVTYQGDIDENIFMDRVKLLVKNSLDNIQYQDISVVLFPAPKVQYNSPVQLTSWFSGDFSQILIVSAVILVLLLLVSFTFLYKKNILINRFLQRRK
ncbi:type III secretion inner membrane ring lipoprotein SctJ [Salmonella enterica]|nr:type III secretion inner membrane ring lipoprotein SctJ [Salmonella enterica]